MASEADTAAAAIELSSSQRLVAEHREGALLVIGGGGSGRSEALAQRLASLVAGGVAPERIAVITVSDAAASRIRARAEELIDRPYERLHVHTFEGAAELLLREFAVEAGLDPFFATVGAADRLAMLLDRIDELPLRRHEIRGNPAGLLARLLERIDALKEEGVTPGALREWAARRRRSASDRDDRETAAREADFAELYERHDRLLRESASLDRGDLILVLADLVRSRPDVRSEVRGRLDSLMADELEDVGSARFELLAELAPDSGLVAAWHGEQGIRRYRLSAAEALESFRAAYPNTTEVRLDRSFRAGPRRLEVARAVASLVPKPLRGVDEQRVEAAAAEASEAPVRFWHCENERAQAQAVAREVEQLLAAGEVPPERICVVIAPGSREGRLVAAALEERSVPFRTPGAAALFRRGEVRDVIAWLRILTDPADAAAAVRALSRPPIALRSSDLARCTTIARRRKLDMISAVEAAIESPQVPPESRDRLRSFLKLYRAAASRLDELRPEVFLRRLIERVGIRRHNLFAASPETAERLASLSRLAELGAAWTRRHPTGSSREFVSYLTAVSEAGERFDERSAEVIPGAVVLADAAQVKGLEFECVYLVGLHRGALGGHSVRDRWVPDELAGLALPVASEELALARRARLAYTALTRATRSVVLAWPGARPDGDARPSAVYEAAMAAAGEEPEHREEELFGPAEGLHSTYRMLRDEVLESSWRAGGALSEMRLDTADDVNRAVVRFLELLKLAALIQRPGAEPAPDALAALNDLLGRAATPEQRAALESSWLDEHILRSERESELRQKLIGSRSEPSLEQFLPRKGEGLGLSASDIDLYRTCPLKYKFARVFAIPQEPTINLRFGILIHQVLERFHTGELRGEAGSEESGLDRLLALFEAGWRRAGFGSSDDELQYRDRAVAALARYHERHLHSDSRPVWLERSFHFKIGDHQLRGRVDRIDRLVDGSYELIDYKTGAPKAAAELGDDVQLALYRIAAQKSWELDASHGAYWYVLDDAKVEVAGSADDLERVERTVVEVGEGISGQDFEPKPDYEVCSWCDYRLICPASEA